MSHGTDYRPSLWFVAFGGVLIALAFPLQPIPYLAPVSFWPFIFVGCAPFLTRLQRCKTFSEATSTAICFGLAWFLVAGVWIFRVFDVLGWVLIWIPAMWIAVFAWSAHLSRKAGLPIVIAWPLLWIAIEIIRAEWSPLRLDWLSNHLDPLNFTWFGLGHPRLTWPAAAQSADLIGGYGLSITPFLVNLLLARFKDLNRQCSFAVFVVVMVLADAGYCWWKWSRPIIGPEIPVGVVQSERYDKAVLLELTKELLAAEPTTKLVVWPELSFSAKDGDQATLLEFARKHQVTLVVGVELPQGDGSYRNRAWWIPPNGDIAEYSKQQRVPFVEHHPASRQCRTFVWQVDSIVINVGVLICYDIDFAWPARQTVSECGAELLILPTLDDVTWGGTQHVQHGLLPRLRAIENRRPLVTAATSGISQILDSRGRRLGGLPFSLHTRPNRPTSYLEGHAFGRITPEKELSFYGRVGYLVPPGIAIIAVFLCLIGVGQCYLAGSRRRIERAKQP